MENYLICPEAIARLVERQGGDKSYDECLKEVNDYIGTLGVIVNLIISNPIRRHRTEFFLTGMLKNWFTLYVNTSGYRSLILPGK